MSDIEQIASLQKGQSLPLQRDVEVISIPFGKTISLPEDSVVSVMQAKGSSVSVAFEGRLYLVEGANLDALGLEALPRPTLHEDASDEEIEQFVWDQLRTCYDPEIPIDVVELGLIYRCELTRLDDQSYRADIDMTLTAPGCGMGDYLVADVRSKVMNLPVISDVQVELTFDPPWTRDMMSETAQLALGVY